MSLPIHVIQVAQHAAGEEPTGQADARTMAALREYDHEHDDFDCSVDSERLIASVAQHAAGLRGKDIDGRMGPKTEAAVRAYAAKHLAGATSTKPAFHTRMAVYQAPQAAGAGAPPALHKDGIDLRAPAVIVPDGGMSEIPNRKTMKAVYGDADALGKEAMQERLVTLTGLPGRFNKGDGVLHGVHRLAAPHLRLALELCARFGVIDEIYRIGTYNHRHMRHDPSMPLSFHAYGVGLDINPRENFAWVPGAPEKHIMPFSDAWRQKYPCGVSEALVLCFKKAGYGWGGDWPGFRDPMHFELVR
jgi:hypothetical protein